MNLLEGEKISSREEMKAEALERMKKMKLDDLIIKAFEKSNKILCSDGEKIIGVPENILKKIKEFEGNYGNLVFHVIHQKVFDFENYDLCYVSIYPDDWEFENSILKDNQMIVRGENISIPDFSESGIVFFEVKNGILSSERKMGMDFDAFESLKKLLDQIKKGDS